jgi:hypothetical protein
MAREAETNPRTIPDARIAARMAISIFLGADTTPKGQHQEVGANGTAGMLSAHVGPFGFLHLFGLDSVTPRGPGEGRAVVNCDVNVTR